MRIDRLVLRNFRMFADAPFEFPRPANGLDDSGAFHLLIGENGSGKTTILDAAAVALGVWLERVPDTVLANSRRPLRPQDKRIVDVQGGDRRQFQQVQEPMSIHATGTVLGKAGSTWGPDLRVGSQRASHASSKDVLDAIKSAYQQIGRGEHVLLPVIAYYGAGRAWLPHNDRRRKKPKANRWEAFYDCLNERIRVADIRQWFQREFIENANRQGRFRPGFEVVRRAVLAAIPGAEDLWYDGDSEEIALSIAGNSQPFGNLSAGQRVMLALVADLAIRMVTQNNFLVDPDELAASNDALPKVLAQTPGVVLIDEVDVHLHPTWQRRVCADLRKVFPKVQFLGTTHSPQVIGSARPEEIIRLLPDGTYEQAAQSYGMDTNWILEVLMGADKEEPAIKRRVADIFDQIGNGALDDAERIVAELQRQIGNSETLQRASSTIERKRIFKR